MKITRLAKLKKVNKGLIRFDVWKFCADGTGAMITMTCTNEGGGFILNNIFS